MKKIKFILLSITCLCFLCSCGNKYVDDSSNELKQSPTVEELLEVVYKNGSYINNMLNNLQDAFATVPDASVESIATVIATVQEQYVNGGGNAYGTDTDDVSYTLTNVAEMATLSSYSAATDNLGPVLIIDDVQLTESDGNKQTVTLVLLAGTKLSETQATGFKEDIYSGMALDNEYLYSAFNTIKAHFTDEQGNVDYNHKLVIQGISLGGMVAQQLTAVYAKYENEGTENFDVLYTTTFGSPILSADIIGTTSVVRRMVMAGDIVPKTSVEYDATNTFTEGGTDTIYPNNTYLYKTCSVANTFVGIHMICYVVKSEWPGVDVLGNENGLGQVTFTKGNMTWYDAPISS